jgi:hypothetical protein
MSRINKVNPDHYKVAGRLSADDLARERSKQGDIRPADLRSSRRKAKRAPETPRTKQSRSANSPGKR